MKASCDAREPAPSDRCAIAISSAVVAVAEMRHQHAAAADAARQRVVDHLARLQLAQQAVGAGGDAADAAVGLVAPVVEAAALGEVVGLVGEARAQAARVALVEADDVVPPASCAIVSRLPRLLPAGSTCDQLRAT